MLLGGSLKGPSDDPDVTVLGVKYVFNPSTLEWQTAPVTIRVLHPNRGIGQDDLHVHFAVEQVEGANATPIPMFAKMFRHNIMNVTEDDYFGEGQSQCLCEEFARQFTAIRLRRLSRGNASTPSFPLLTHRVIVRLPTANVPAEYRDTRKGFFSYRTCDTLEFLFMMEPNTVACAALKVAFNTDHRLTYPPAREATKEELAQIAEGFSHFTYARSAAALVICGLLRVDGYLVDPLVNTFDEKGFGLGNGGLKRIARWMEKHTCTTLCQQLALEPIVKPTQPLPTPTEAQQANMESNYYVAYARKLMAPPPPSPLAAAAAASLPANGQTTPRGGRSSLNSSVKGSLTAAVHTNHTTNRAGGVGASLSASLGTSAAAPSPTTTISGHAAAAAGSRTATTAKATGSTATPAAAGAKAGIRKAQPASVAGAPPPPPPQAAPSPAAATANAHAGGVKTATPAPTIRSPGHGGHITSHRPSGKGKSPTKRGSTSGTTSTSNVSPPQRACSGTPTPAASTHVATPNSSDKTPPPISPTPLPPPIAMNRINLGGTTNTANSTSTAVAGGTGGGASLSNTLNASTNLNGIASGLNGTMNSTTTTNEVNGASTMIVSPRTPRIRSFMPPPSSPAPSAQGSVQTAGDAPAVQPVTVPATKYTFDMRTWRWLSSPIKIRVTNPERGLAEGGMRVCFEVVEINPRTKKESIKVAKMFRRKVADVVEKDYFNVGEVQFLCDAFTSSFNAKPGVSAPLHYVDCSVVRLQREDIPEVYQTKRTGFFSYRTTDTHAMMFNMEPKLEGNFTKYNNNNGLAFSTNEKPLSEEENRKRLRLFEAAEAFSHFTLMESGGGLLVCDVQGVGDQLTDPEIHIYNCDSIGVGNMGRRGIFRFAKCHRCTPVCKAIGLKPFSEVRAPDVTPEVARVNTYLQMAKKMSPPTAV